jgi:hypothetical protein
MSSEINGCIPNLQGTSCKRREIDKEERLCVRSIGFPKAYGEPFLRSIHSPVILDYQVGLSNLWSRDEVCVTTQGKKFPLISKIS